MGSLERVKKARIFLTKRDKLSRSRIEEAETLRASLGFSWLATCFPIYDVSKAAREKREETNRRLRREAGRRSSDLQTYLEDGYEFISALI